VLAATRLKHVPPTGGQSWDAPAEEDQKSTVDA